MEIELNIKEKHNALSSSNIHAKNDFIQSTKISNNDTNEPGQIVSNSDDYNRFNRKIDVKKIPVKQKRIQSSSSSSYSNANDNKRNRSRSYSHSKSKKQKYKKYYYKSNSNSNSNFLSDLEGIIAYFIYFINDR